MQAVPEHLVLLGGEDADLEAAVSALLGSYFADYMAGRGGGRPEWAEQAVDFTLAALRASNT